MKTPRDLLFARHQAAAPKLDAIRRAAVAAAGDRHNFAGRRPPTAATNIFLTLWQELFLPGRRIWSGLAGAWVLIIAVNLAQHDPSPTGKAAPAPAMMSFREQQRLMNELFADRLPPGDAEPPKTFSPKPRTEICRAFTA
jgi:hypothetical protein